MPCKYSFLLLPFFVIVVWFGAWAQPLPHAKETLAVEATAHRIAVPPQAQISGGHLQEVQLVNQTLMVSGSSKEFAYLAFFQHLGDDFRFLGLKKLATNPLNHAGGFQVAENWLAVGIEDPVGRRQSIVQLFDISSSEQLHKPPVYTLRRKGTYQYSTAGAVALLKRANHFLLAVGTWDSRTIDFYISNHLNPYADDFTFEKWTTWDSREAIRREWIDRKYGRYQSLQLTQDTTGIYITGFCRTANGTNRADVFQMHTDTDPYTMMQKVATYRVQCSGNASFRYGAGLATYNSKSTIIAIGSQLVPQMQVQLFPIKE